jgi:hypothetical protein
MTVAKNADVANVQEALVAEVVQRELQAQAKLSGLFKDYSELVGKGTSSLKIPRSDSFSVQDRDNATPTPASAQNLTFSFDQIDLDQSKYVYYVIPGDVELDAKPSYELTAAQRAASAHGRNMDIARLNELWGGANASQDVDFVSGTSDVEDTILQMIQKADEANMLDDGERYLIVRPQERKQLLGVANFVQADRYGINPSRPLVSGELGSVYGVRIIVTNLAGSVAATTGGTFGDGDMILCHRESLAFAFHRQPTHDMDKAIEYGAGSMAHSWDIKYGLKSCQGGDLIVRAWDLP